MGAELFARYPNLCAAADEILGYSIVDLCLEDSGRNLRLTSFTQPALFVVNALTWLDRSEREPPPSFLAGHSLGEYNALFAAGCFDFETGLRLVQRRGALMSPNQDGGLEDGGMAAVLGLDAERVAAVLQEQDAPVDIANFNLPQQLVLSGPKSDLERLVEPLETAGARRCIVLNVSGPFHSRYMASAAAELESFLGGFRFAAPQIEVVANCTAQPYTVDSIARLLTQQVRSPVRWSQTMDYLRSRGVTELEELGPGKVLQKLWAAAPEPAAAQPPAGPPPAEQPPVAKPPARQPSAGRPSATPAGGAEHLGDPLFRQDYGLRYAYVAGAPTGIRTPEMVIVLGKRGCLTFLDVDVGTSGTDTALMQSRQDAAALAIQQVSRALGQGRNFGISLRPPAMDAPPGTTTEEDLLVDVALQQGVRAAEAVGYHRITPALVRFRFRGAHRDTPGRPVTRRHLLAQVSQVATAALFLKPAPEKIVASLVDRGELTVEEGEIARQLPMSDDLCVVAAPADGIEMATLLPAVQHLRAKLPAPDSAKRIRVGAGGCGTPQAIACAFLLGADFVQTSAVNMTAVEAATPPDLKALLAGLDIGETAVVPAAGGFLLGARTQAVKKGSLFVPRARKLDQLFHFYDSLEDLEPAQREKLETTYFKRSLASVWDSLQNGHSWNDGDPKRKMALVFDWYLRQSLRWALDGTEAEKLNYQIPCDESVAAFNLYAADTPLADPAGRTAADLAETLMRDAAAFLARSAQ